ncbi:MAG: histidine phosphatase family protein [Acutalibacteraceae bacterium]|jgi:broad specificity phosphatase PhoE
MTTIYLIRHCETQGNKKRLFQGHIDMPISAEGESQLQRLAERFRDIALDRIYSSPLGRAMRTAQAVDRYHGLDITVDERLIEINVGVWEGKPWNELMQTDPEHCDVWSWRPWLFEPEKGEPMRSVFDRMSRAITDIAAANAGKRIAVVSHGCAIRNAICFAKGWPIERLGEIGWIDNTGYCQLDFDGEAIRITGEPSLEDDWWPEETR